MSKAGRFSNAKVRSDSEKLLTFEHRRSHTPADLRALDNVLLNHIEGAAGMSNRRETEGSARALLQRASELLNNATTIAECHSARELAEAARAFIKAARLGLELQNNAAEAKLRAERRIGAFLRELKLRGGDRRSKGLQTTLKLSDLGIAKQQSRRWQQLSEIPEVRFQAYIRLQNEHSREVTARGALKFHAMGGINGVDRAIRKRSSAPDSSMQRVRVRATGEDLLIILDELQGHVVTLSSILRPLQDADCAALDRTERRLVARLAGEAAALVGQALVKVDIPPRFRRSHAC